MKTWTSIVFIAGTFSQPILAAKANYDTQGTVKSSLEIRDELVSFYPINSSAKLCDKMAGDLGKLSASSFGEYERLKPGLGKIASGATFGEFRAICVENVELKIERAVTALGKKVDAPHWASYDDFRQSRVGGVFVAAIKGGYDALMVASMSGDPDPGTKMDAYVTSALSTLTPSDKADLKRLMDGMPGETMDALRAVMVENDAFAPDEMRNEDWERIKRVVKQKTTEALNAK